MKFNAINFNTPYCANFYGNSSYDYCFIFYGQPNTISGAMESIIEQYSPFNYLIENIGNDIITFDGSNPTYVPYTLTFNIGANQADVINKLRDLYAGWETFFNIYGVFRCRKIPSMLDDEVVLNEEIFEKLVISENATYNFKTIKNVTEIWGKLQETNRYDNNPVISMETNSIIIDLSLKHYACKEDGTHNDNYCYTNEVVSFVMPNIYTNLDLSNYSIYIRINYNEDINNKLETLPMILLINNYTTKQKTSISKLIAGNVYCISVKNNYALFRGESQVHAICLLVDEEPSEADKQTDMEKYNCSEISYRVINKNMITYGHETTNTVYGNVESPYTIEKIGRIHQVLSDENIYTSDLAAQRARYETWKSAQLTDSITITTRLIPFLDVNIKIKYKSIHNQKVDTYIIDSFSHNFNDYTSSIIMHKFYPADSVVC